MSLKPRAFTIIEAMITLVVVGLLSSVAIVGLGSVSDHGAATAARADAMSTLQAVDNYWAVNGVVPPYSEVVSKALGASVAGTSGDSSYLYASIQADADDETVKIARVDSNGNCWMIFRDYAPGVGEPETVYSVDMSGGTTACNASAAITSLGSDPVTGDTFMNPARIPS